MGNNHFLYLLKIGSPVSYLIFDWGFFYPFLHSVDIYYVCVYVYVYTCYIYCMCVKPYCITWGVLVPWIWLDIKFMFPAVEEQSLNHWTSRQVTRYILYSKEYTNHRMFFKNWISDFMSSRNLEFVRNIHM